MCEDINKGSLDAEEPYFKHVTGVNKGPPPVSVMIATALYVAELVNAAVLCKMYSDTNDRFWMGFTITFMLVPSLVTQLTLTFIHRDLESDRPLVLCLHLLLLGPLIRCIEALVIYFQAGETEEPYVTISRKIKLTGRQTTPTEREISQSERKLATYRNAAKRSAIIQAFLGSAPQLMLQLYVSIQEKSMLPARVSLITINLLSITFGTLVCNVLAIEIKYDDYKIRLQPRAYVCMVLWRGLEIATRTIALVLFSTALKFWVMPIGFCNLLIFFTLPWVLFWKKRASLPDSLEKNLSKFGTIVALCLITFLYACINTFCYSAIQLDLAHRDLIEKRMSWVQIATYYSLRFAENTFLVVMWYFFKSDFYEYICAPMLVLQLVVCYILAVTFMMVFYQYCHPCRHLFSHNVADCLRCACCQRETGPAVPVDVIVSDHVTEDDRPCLFGNRRYTKTCSTVGIFPLLPAVRVP
ncbi:endoplasmic reticulum membrane adapter protein XK-like [Brienomyrus brachyistius]|uniref:endoplasmic reticulum membrane adapter protein XK-like n=1 Tax=Brienomyrus brachyistius TaxID=42636 RepID=UPI0020B2B4DB|nr:endoplasmic reticulum membrane adapter protein XK-like [Brienomyrus brachyistius]